MWRPKKNKQNLRFKNSSLYNKLYFCPLLLRKQFNNISSVHFSINTNIQFKVIKPLINITEIIDEAHSQMPIF